MGKTLTVIVILMICCSSALATPKEEKAFKEVIKKLEGISYSYTSGHQKPEETLSKRSGNCVDFAKLTKHLLEKEGIKSKIVIERTGRPFIKHAVVKVSVGIKNYKISNGKVTQVW